MLRIHEIYPILDSVEEASSDGAQLPILPGIAQFWDRWQRLPPLVWDLPLPELGTQATSGTCSALRLIFVHTIRRSCLQLSTERKVLPPC